MKNLKKEDQIIKKVEKILKDSIESNLLYSIENLRGHDYKYFDFESYREVIRNLYGKLYEDRKELFTTKGIEPHDIHLEFKGKTNFTRANTINISESFTNNVFYNREEIDIFENINSCWANNPYDVVVYLAIAEFGEYIYKLDKRENSKINIIELLCEENSELFTFDNYEEL